jgi:prephenate dehydrogenase
MKIIIIGYGRFGKLLTTILTQDKFDLKVITSQKVTLPAQVKLAKWNDLTEADLVIPAVPISQFEKTIIKIAPLLKPGAICLDICSVKEYPAQVMLDNLLDNIQIVATHPLFGPDSFVSNGGLKNLRISVSPIRINPEVYKKILDYFRKLKLEIIEQSPAEHDQLIAQTQLYSFLVGSLSNSLNIQNTSIDTYWYNLLVEHSQVVKKDGPQLFQDMIKYNRFSSSFVKKFKTNVIQIDSFI